MGGSRAESFSANFSRVRQYRNVTDNRRADGEDQVPRRAGDCILPLDEAACRHLLVQHGPMVKAACQRILGDPTMAEDIAQEAFLLLVRKLPLLPPRTILGGWLYVTAGNLARTHQRNQARRWRRENQPEVREHLMRPAQDTLWHELEPLLDDAMLTLSQRQRELVLSRFFQNSSQRAAAALVGCSETVASRELASAIELLRKFFSRRGVTVSATALSALLVSNGAQASVGIGAAAAPLSMASTLANTSSTPLFFTLMNATTTTKIIGAAIALAIVTGTVRHFTRTDAIRVADSNPEKREVPIAARVEAPALNPGAAPAPAGKPSRGNRQSPEPATANDAKLLAERAFKAAREKQDRFLQRLGELALVGDPLKVQELLKNEFGITLSADEVRSLQANGPKGFSFGVVDLWASRQPREALAWAASTVTAPGRSGVDLQQLFLDAARRSLPNLDRESLAGMLPEAPGANRMLDLLEASVDPAALANRILTVTDPEERVSRLRVLAQGWSDSVLSAQWARENLSGEDKTAFYAQVGYNLAHQNPQAALDVLADLKGSDAYVSTFDSMMRGLVQEGGLGQQAAELIANANLPAKERADLISELARRWVRNDPDATIAWANSLTDPVDFRAAIPLLVSQLDSDRISRTVEAFMKNPDPTMELALIEAAAPPGLYFDPEKSRQILDPLINIDPTLRISSNEGNTSSKDALLWSSVNQTAKRQAESGSPAAAMEWLGSLPFSSQEDYSQALANVMAVWSIKSPGEATAWLQSSGLNPTITAVLRAALRP
jgi:RNA polymerase sigma factor (sigma-70 family)